MSSRYRDELDFDRYDRHREKRKYDEHDDRYYVNSRHRNRSRSRDRNRRSRSRDRYKKRSRSRSHRSSSRSRKSRSHSRKPKTHSRRSRSREKRHSRSKSRESRRHRRSHRSSSGENRNENDCSNKTEVYDRQQQNQQELKSSESTLDAFDSQSNENTQYIGEIESEEERKKIHEQMQERLRKLQEQEPKRIHPSRSSTSKHTPFANDGSFLEMFKQMQQRFQLEQQQEQKDQERLKLPIVGRRRGGKILKTGIVEKPKKIEENPVDGPKDAWSLYLQEVKRYKNATCDPDAPSRSLVK